MGKTVSNEGVITATLGTVALTSGSKITLNFDGNSLFDVSIDEGVMNALVENKQLIKADGGKVILTAKAADAVLSAQVNNSGTIQARTMADLTGGTTTYRKGSITLKADGGTTKVTGKLDASAPNGGDGGFIETSGNTVKIDDAAVITTLASYGITGTWLIDPDGFTIAATGGDITGTALAKQLASNNVVIESTDGSGSDGNITVNDTVTWSANTTLELDATNAVIVNAALTGSGTSSGLVLNAGTDIDINAVSALQVATLTATAGGDINFNAAQSWTTAGNWTFTAGTDININDTVDWSDGTLTLNAGASGGFINVNAVMTASDNASLVITYNTGMDTSTETVDNFDGWGSTDTAPTSTYGTQYGGVNYLQAADGASYIGKINFTNNTAATALTINSNIYTLITSMEQLDALDGYNAATGTGTATAVTGYYAIAFDLDAAGTTYIKALLGTSESTSFNGTLDGLGHTISNLTITPTTAGTSYIGLIGVAGTSAGGLSSSMIRNLGLVGVQINDSASGYTTSGSGVGSLVGYNYGTIIGAFATGNDAGVPTGSSFDGTTYPEVTAAVSGGTEVGGLVGYNAGLIVDSHADVDVYGNTDTGGLVGENTRRSNGTGGVIFNSYATGTVSAGKPAASTGGYLGIGHVGGLVGFNNSGVISDSYSTGDVYSLNVSQVGGFAGYNLSALGVASLDNVYSSGTVYIYWSATAGNGYSAGGLVGENAGHINDSSTTSDVVVSSTVRDYYNVGAFVGEEGYDGDGASVSNSAAYGTVTKTVNGTTTTITKLIGNSNPTTNSYYLPGETPSSTLQSTSEAAATAAVEQAANARAEAQTQAQQAAAQQAAVAAATAAAAAAAQARLEAAGNAAMVAATTGTLQAADNPPGASDAKAGTALTSALAGPSVASHVDTDGAPPPTTSWRQLQEQEERRRKRQAQQGRKPVQPVGYGGTIRSIDVDGQHFDLENDATPPAPTPPAAPTR